MILKRLGAIALAVILIGGAWLVRDRVIDDDGGGGGSSSGDNDPPPAGREIVCVTDLREACDALADTHDDLVIRIVDAGETLDALTELEDPSEAPIWITMAPLPEMVDDLRAAARTAPMGTQQTTIASSPIALVVLADRASALTAACGNPLDWHCVGAAAGQSWEEIGGDPSFGLVRPAFAPIESTFGLLGVADAVSGYFGASPLQLEDPSFVSWGRRLARAVPASAVSGPTAIATIQIRASALDIAVGPAAELSDTSRSPVTPQYADPMVRADVVVAVPIQTSLPSGLIEDLRRLLITEGKWDAASTDRNPLPSARDMLAIRSAWELFS
ncbi:MAG TPA: hypothetical protein VFV63_12045 [Ilumatobacteraceae bacterium]|nr:hypothetical protein [Ilumatobacteraceae bacterium]